MHDAMTLFGVLARGELPTRIPITANLPDQGPEELVIAAREYYSSPARAGHEFNTYIPEAYFRWRPVKNA
jgi:hypothetical protein